MRGVVALLALCSAAFAEPEIGYAKGQIHPDFELPRLDGTLGRLSAYRGRKVLVFNFASW